MTEEELRAIVELEEYVMHVAHWAEADWIGTIHHRNGLARDKRLVVSTAETKEGCINKLYKRWVEAK